MNIKKIKSNLQLDINNLSCIRNENPLFESLSFTLGSSQALLLEGNNGSGKTTLLRILCGFRRQDSGDINWCKQPAENTENRFFQNITYIGHKNAIKDELTAEENVAMACSMEHADPDTAFELLKSLKLASQADLFARQLSAGQKRRLSLSRLLISQRPLWILDEPFTSLDADTVTFFENLLAQHVNAGGMLIMTAHHQVNLGDIDLKHLSLPGH